MTVLALEGEGDDWRLHLNGDWSLAAMAQIEARLKGLPDTLRGTLVCDWSRAEAPGIGPVWALLMRLSDLGTQHLDVRHTGNPPHYLELLQKVKSERHAARAARAGIRHTDCHGGYLPRYAGVVPSFPTAAHRGHDHPRPGYLVSNLQPGRRHRRRTHAAQEVGGAAADLRIIEAQTAPDIKSAVANIRHVADNLARISDRLEHFVADNEPGVSRFTHQSLPEFEQLLRESRQAARDFRDLSRSLKQNPSQLIYEPNYRGVEVAK